MVNKTGLIFWPNGLLVRRGACFGYFNSLLRARAYLMTDFLAVYEFFVANRPCWVMAYCALGVLEWPCLDSAACPASIGAPFTTSHFEPFWCAREHFGYSCNLHAFGVWSVVGPVHYSQNWAISIALTKQSGIRNPA